MGPTDNIERYIKESGEDSMTLQKKQMGERNQIGMIIGMMITIAMIALEITLLDKELIWKSILN